MLTALTIKIAEKEKGIRGLLGRLKRDNAIIDVDRVRGVYFKHITYVSYGKKLHLERLEKVLGDSRTRILCDEKTEFPEKSGMKRFYNTDFSARLCTNFVLNLLKECEFAESKNASSGNEGGYTGGNYNRPAPSGAGDGFMNIPDGIDEELPFN